MFGVAKKSGAKNLTVCFINQSSTRFTRLRTGGPEIRSANQSNPIRLDCLRLDLIGFAIINLNKFPGSNLKLVFLFASNKQLNGIVIKAGDSAVESETAESVVISADIKLLPFVVKTNSTNYIELQLRTFILELS